MPPRSFAERKATIDDLAAGVVQAHSWVGIAVGIATAGLIVIIIGYTLGIRRKGT